MVPERVSLIHSLPCVSGNNSFNNPLPQILQTPSGLAILEIQGTINLPTESYVEDIECAKNGNSECHPPELDARSQPRGNEIGRLVFPDYDIEDESNTVWMKRVYMYVGQHQRLTGEVRALPKAVAILRRSKDRDDNHVTREEIVSDEVENSKKILDSSDIQLEIVEIVKYKILFANRPEPVGVRDF